MGWQDRAYSDPSYDGSPSVVGGIRRPRGVTLALMVLHGAAFLLMHMLLAGEGEFVVRMMTLGEMSAALGTAEVAVHPLGIFLHPLATTRWLSVLFVVLALWSLGGRLAAVLGAGRLIGLYVAGNVVAGVAFYGVALAAPRLAVATLDYPVGALAGLCLVAWQRLRQQPVMVFKWMTNAGKMYAICGVIVAGLVVLRSGLGAAAWLAAAAAGVGVAALGQQWTGSWLPRWRRRRRVVRPSIPRPTARPLATDDPDIDDLLAKISRAGLDALTDEERQRLEEARRAKLHRPR